MFSQHILRVSFKKVVKTLGEVVSWFKKMLHIDSHATLWIPLQIDEELLCGWAVLLYWDPALPHTWFLY